MCDLETLVKATRFKQWTENPKVYKRGNSVEEKGNSLFHSHLWLTLELPEPFRSSERQRRVKSSSSSFVLWPLNQRRNSKLDLDIGLCVLHQFLFGALSWSNGGVRNLRNPKPRLEAAQSRSSVLGTFLSVPVIVSYWICTLMDDCILIRCLVMDSSIVS